MFMEDEDSRLDGDLRKQPSPLQGSHSSESSTQPSASSATHSSASCSTETTSTQHSESPSSQHSESSATHSSASCSTETTSTQHSESPSSQHSESSATHSSASCSTETTSTQHSESPSSQHSESSATQHSASVGVNLVLEKLIKFTVKEKQNELLAKLIELGVETLSDLNFLNLDDAFKGLLSPVKIGRLKAELSKVADQPCENTDQPETGGCLKFQEIFGESFLQILKGNERLPKSLRLKLIRDVGDCIISKQLPVTEDYCKKVAVLLQKSFKGALDSGSECHSKIDLGGQILAHCRYERKSRAKKRVNSDSGNTESMPLKKFSKRQNFGISPELDFPTSFPENEDANSLRLKKAELISMYSSGKWDKKKVTSLMRETYVLQRNTIHENKTMEEFLKEWPFLGKFPYLRDHFYKEMGLNEEKCIKRLKTFCPKFLQFLRAETHIKRAGESAVLVTKLKELIDCFDKIEDKDGRSEFIAVFIGAALKLRMKASPFLHFEETTSYDEIQASSRLPDDGKPIVVVLGKNLLSNPKCNVLVEKRLISEDFTNPAMAIFSAFMCYWVHKYLYPPKLAPIFDFLQQEIFQMNLNVEGNSLISRVDREKSDKGWKSAPKAISPKYLSLMREYKDFCYKWKIDP